MEEKKIPYWWAALIGLLMLVIQVLIFYIRFGELNQEGTLLDYFVFFLAGTIGGLLLIYLLRRSKTKAANWIVIVAFILATPIALMGMVVGGLAGPVGAVFTSVMLWGMITGMGFLVGRFLSRNA